MNRTNVPLIDPAEWDAQERGMRAVQGHDTAGLDAAAANYRIVAGAVMSTPHARPPADFAADVVRRVARHEAGLERLLSRMLLVVFLIASAIVGAHYGASWWQTLHQALNGEAWGWVLAGVGCVALSWLGKRLPELAGHAGGAKLAR